GKPHDLFTPAPGRTPPPAAALAQHGMARRRAAWTGRSGERRVVSQGFPGAEGLGTAVWGKPGGQVFRHGKDERRAARRSDVSCISILAEIDSECRGAFGISACGGGVSGVARLVGSTLVQGR